MPLICRELLIYYTLGGFMGESEDVLGQPLYTVAEFYLLRAPVLPALVFLQIASSSCITSTRDEVDDAWVKARQNCYNMLQAMAAQSEIEQALAVASSALSEG